MSRKREKTALSFLPQAEDQSQRRGYSPGNVHKSGHRGVKQGGQGQDGRQGQPQPRPPPAAGEGPQQRQQREEAKIADGHEVHPPGGAEEQGKGHAEKSNGVVVVAGEDGLVHLPQGGQNTLVPEGLGQRVSTAPVDGAVPAVEGLAPGGVGEHRQINRQPQPQKGQPVPPPQAPHPPRKARQTLPQGEEQMEKKHPQQHASPCQRQQIYPPRQPEPGALQRAVQDDPPPAQAAGHAQGIHPPAPAGAAQGPPAQMVPHRRRQKGPQQGQPRREQSHQAQRENHPPALYQKGPQPQRQKEAHQSPPRPDNTAGCSRSPPAGAALSVPAYTSPPAKKAPRGSRAPRRAGVLTLSCRPPAPRRRRCPWRWRTVLYVYLLLGTMILVALPLAAAWNASRALMVRTPSPGLASLMRRMASAVACCTFRMASAWASASRILACLAPSAWRMAACLAASARRNGALLLAPRPPESGTASGLRPGEWPPGAPARPASASPWTPECPGAA